MAVSPFDRIVAHYESEGIDWRESRGFCQKWGVCVEDGDCLLWAVPVNRAELMRFVLPRARTGMASADTWLIAALAGDMERAWLHEPYHLPWFAFQRRGSRLHIWRRDRIRHLTSRHLAAT